MARRHRCFISGAFTVVALLGAVTSGAGATSPPPTAANTSDLSRVWTGEVGGSATPIAIGDALVAVMTDRIVGYDAYRTDRCTQGGRCLPRWSVALPARRTGPAAVAGTWLYVPTATGLITFPIGACARATSCAPVFVAPTTSPIVSRPVVAGVDVVVGTEDGRVLAFDAGGITGCTTAYTTCSVRWWARPRLGRPVYPVAGAGIVAVVADDGWIAAYSENPAPACANAAAPCAPRWTAPGRGPVTGLPGAGGGLVVLPLGDRLIAFPLNPAFNCTAGPVVCQPLWSAPTGARVSALRVNNERAIAATATGAILTFDTTARSGCTPLPATCLPVWTASVIGVPRARPTITNGVVTVVTDRGRVTRYDLAGLDHCSSRKCSSLWSTTIDPSAAPATVGRGSLFVASSAGRISAFRIVVDDRTRRHRGRPLTADHDDTYTVSDISGGISMRAPSTNVGGNTRVVLSDPASALTADHEACATWTAESHWIDQEGIALRVHGITGGGTSAITVTKNIWTGARWIFNVHVWSSTMDPPILQIGAFDLSRTFFPNQSILPLPWRMCARVVRDVVTFQVWPADSPRPAAGDPDFGGSVRLPAGWSTPGRPGWYVGHLRAGESVSYTDLTSRTVSAAGAGTGTVREPTAIQLAP